VINEHLHVPAHRPHLRNITVHSLKDPHHKKHKVWRAVGYIPCSNPREAVDLYSQPPLHLQYDDDATLRKLQRFVIDRSDDGDTEYDINVGVTNSKMNGLISPRLSVNGAVCKYSESLGAVCCLARFVPQSMVKQLTGALRVTPRDLTHVVSRNLNLCWAATPCAEEASLVRVSYVLQCNNGGWIPRWAVESGMVDRHLVAIFKQITRWINGRAEAAQQAMAQEMEMAQDIEEDELEGVEAVQSERVPFEMALQQLQARQSEDVAVPAAEAGDEATRTIAKIEEECVDSHEGDTSETGGFGEFVDVEGARVEEWVDVDDHALLSECQKKEEEAEVVSEWVHVWT